MNLVNFKLPSSCILEKHVGELHTLSSMSLSYALDMGSISRMTRQLVRFTVYSDGGIVCNILNSGLWKIAAGLQISYSGLFVKATI